MPEYETKLTRLTVKPVGEPVYSEMATNISVDDEGGEYVVLEQLRGSKSESISINPEEWPTLRDAIDKMVALCESNEKMDTRRTGE